MTPNIILLNITCVSFFLLAFIAFFNPLKVNIIANKWLGVFLFAVGSAILDVIISGTNARSDYARVIAFNELSRFAMMPALYLAVLHYTSPDKVLRKTEYLHFLPFFIFFILTASFVIKPGWSVFNAETVPAILKIVVQIFIRLSIPTQLVVYWLLSYYALIRHHKNIQLVTSNTIPVNLSWLRFLLFGILFMILISLMDRLWGGQFLKMYSPIGYLVGTLCLAYFFLAQKEIYPYETPELESINAIINPEQKSVLAKPRFSEETLLLLKSRVTNLMKTERLFLDNELGLPELAKEMNVSPHDLSYLLNEGFGVNFFQFINSYRIEEAKQLMLSEKYRHLNILGIAYSAGFNSKTTFNTAFKKETGLSPSQFIQQDKGGTAAAASLQ
ncbi:MAG: AraC family transcriptional regulator [Bacteroidota bacterium]